MKLLFWGATDDVTGSMTFLKLPEGDVLIDCGLAQGTSETEKINDIPLPVNPKMLKAVFITHAHLDHSGYLPRLVRKGFNGPIYCTPPTAKLMRIILLDSANLNEDDFYNKQDVEKTLHMVKTYEWDEHFDFAGASARFVPAGHILGASSLLIKAQGKSIVFSGDLGRTDDPLLPPLSPGPSADIVVMESTYGSKVRSADMKKDLHSFLATIARDSRIGIIASFAVARAQTLLTLIHEFHENHPEYKVRVVMDSPMMKEANKVYQQYSRLTTKAESLFAALDEIDAIEYQKEWQSLKNKSGPLVILSSSGMLTGGRISRHLANWCDEEKAILFLPGYQGKGTPGRAFTEGRRELKGPDGRMVVWTGEVWTSEAFSSHADQKDLIEWVSHNNQNSKVFLLHGELEAKKSLKQKLEESTNLQVEIAERGQEHSVS